MNLADLKKPFPPDRISWRVGSMTQDKKKGMALAYIDARDVMGRLDEVCGAGWQCEYIPMPNGTCCCRIGIKVGEEWIWRSNGALTLSDRDTVDAKEMAEKGSYSDAFKRAAVLFGIGQYLYDLDSPWVELDDKKRIIQSEYKKLEALLGGKSAPVRYGDEDGQAREWVTRQITLIKGSATLPALYLWLSKRCGDGGTISDPNTSSDMDKLKVKSPEMYGQVVQAFQAQLMAINRNQKEAAE
jgi:Uncharacterized protein conserved in bacteria